MLQIWRNYLEHCAQSAVLHFMGSPTEYRLEVISIFSLTCSHFSAETAKTNARVNIYCELIFGFFEIISNTDSSLISFDKAQRFFTDLKKTPKPT